eukprot:364749-Chlamydomonas_euryale.AAC.4
MPKHSAAVSSCRGAKHRRWVAGAVRPPLPAPARGRGRGGGGGGRPCHDTAARPTTCMGSWLTPAPAACACVRFAFPAHAQRCAALPPIPYRCHPKCQRIIWPHLWDHFNGDLGAGGLADSGQHLAVGTVRHQLRPSIHVLKALARQLLDEDLRSANGRLVLY